MSNKIIEEQRRAREEKINIIKAKQGLVEIEEKDDSAVIIPKTPAEKVANYWYHFKWHTIGALMLIAVLSVLIVQCASRQNYDFITVVYTHTPIESGRMEKIEEYLEQFSEDIDGDGKVSIEVVNCSFADTQSNSTTNQAAVAKVQSMIAAEPKAVLYIVDKKAVNTLNSLNEKGFFDAEPLELDEEFYLFCEGESEFEKLPDGLKIGYRRINGTLMEDDKTANKVYEVCKKIYEEMLE